MNASTTAVAPARHDLEAYAWIAFIVAAVVVLLLGAVHVGATNAAQNAMVGVPAATPGGSDR